ncbi:response regulator transcription factor [Ammoniphilus sp. CFH 90114]|uniref:response regulator n=1 Tax=Ammoniphilus sp. CFH 90114 TaxID=2493665 RepID=UPI00100E6235|nr:response regulator transcription factor [Ammoniphilus sp. CFH 90114]RXT06399.1 response regulator transcription factor [Ammoniphilus sp. CFH 90114]
MKPIRVMLVEDDPVWLTGIQDLINQEEDMEVVGTAATKTHALHQFESCHSDVVILDINLTENNLDGIELALDLMDRKESTKIIMMTSLTREEVIVDSFSAGVVNYLNKLHFKEIVPAIRDAYHNRSNIHPSAALALRQEFLRLKREEDQNLLTTSEKEILQRIHKGETQSEMEKSLFISKRTIKNHINRILKKMGLKSSKDAAAIAKKKKMI